MNNIDSMKKFIKKTILIYLTLFFPISAFAINGKISGIVKDADTNEPLPAVNIVLPGTVRGASTDMQGQFIIKDLPPGTYSVRVSRIGYRTITKQNIKVQLNKENRLSISMKETALEFDPIVVLAGKSQQQLDQANVSMSVITSTEIERRNPVDVIQALETAPGIHFVGTQINIRGSSGFSFGVGNKVLLLLDGVPVYASDTGEFNWDMISPSDIKQVEILKGAGSTLWGASALGGVVNIITKDPTPEGKFHVAYTIGKYDHPYHSEWEWTDPDRLHYTREDISYSKQAGNIGFRISTGRLISTGYSQLGDAVKFNIAGKFDYKFGANYKWTFYTAYNENERGFFIQWKGPNSPYEVEPINLENRAKVKQLNTYTKFSFPLSAKFAVNLRFSFVRSLMGNQFGHGSSFNPAIGQGMEVQSDWIPVDGHIITSGIQYQYDSGNAKYFGSHKGYLIGPYVQDEWKIQKNLRLTTGFRYDRYQLIGGEKEDLFSPRMGINWQAWPTTSFRASAGSGFRAATIVERFLELSIMNFKIVPNDTLKAESSWAFDAGMRHYFNENWNIDISLFQNDYWELIEAHLDLFRGQIKFRNVPRARIKGLEVTTNAGFPMQIKNKHMTPGFQISLTAMDHKDLKYNEPLTYRPDVLFSLKSFLQFSAFRYEIDYRYASRIEQVKLYPVNERVPMKFVDTRLSWNYKNLTVQFSINNLFNYNYAPMESNLEPMRRFILGLKGDF